LGDLHRKLDDEPAAVAAYWRVVEQKTSAGDLLGAAALLEGRLELPNKALTLLGKAWPGSPQAAQCLTEQFSLLARLRLHEAARERVLELRDEQTPTRQVIPLAEVLARLRKTYPDGLLRPLAADVARVKISARLTAGDASEARAGTRLLSDLAPEDRLLARDASRFLASRLEVLARRSPPALPPPLPRKSGSKRCGVPSRVGEFFLTTCEEILAVRGVGPYFVAAIREKQRGSFTNMPHTAIVRGDWEGYWQSRVWTKKALRRGQVSFASHEGTGPLLVLTQPEMIRNEAILPGTDQIPHPLALSAPAWLPDGVAAVTARSGHLWILRNTGSEWIVDVRFGNGSLTTEFSLQYLLADISEPVVTVAMLAIRSQVWIALGHHLFRFDEPRKPAQHWECESPILRLEPSAPFLTRALVARCAQGVAVFWCDQLKDHVEMLASDLAEPFCAWLGNGMLALLSSQEGPDGYSGRIIDLDRRGVHSEANFSWKEGSPAGLVALPRPDAFAVFTREGKVQIFHVPTVD
jgi:hypothetical protein